jgi:hypothetical protein
MLVVPPISADRGVDKQGDPFNFDLNFFPLPLLHLLSLLLLLPVTKEKERTM